LFPDFLPCNDIESLSGVQTRKRQVHQCVRPERSKWNAVVKRLGLEGSQSWQDIREADWESGLGRPDAGARE
jgi:hypothetical protein